MHWKTVQKSTRAVFEGSASALRVESVYARIVPSCSHEAVDKALAGLVKSGEVTLTRGWYRLAKKE